MRRSIRHALVLGITGALALPAIGAAAVGDITEFGVTGADPIAITSGPDGNLWIAQYTDSGAPPLDSGVGKMTPAGAFTGYTAGIEPDSGPTSIVGGPDGNLWYTREFNPVPALMKVTTLGAVSVAATFPVPANARARSVVVGPDGNLWLAIADGIVRSTTGGSVTTFPVPVPLNLSALATGPGGAVWSVDTPGEALARTTMDGATTQVATFPAGSLPAGIAAGPDGNLWVPLKGTSPTSIARVTPTGSTTRFDVPSNSNRLKGITAGADGNLWFTEEDTGRIGRITTSGQVTEYVVPRVGAAPYAIAAGPDGNVWYTDLVGKKVGRVLTGVVPSSTAAPVVTGTPKVGQVLTVSKGTWNHVPAGYAYAWQRCTSAAATGCSTVRDQLASTYTVTREDVGKFLIASVTATSLNGDSQAATSPAVQVAALPRLTITWSRTKTKRKKATITALVTPRSGATSYRMAALLTSGPNAYRSDQNTRSGRCVRAKVKLKANKGKKPRTVIRQRCTITLPVGAWSVTAEGSRGPELLAYATRGFRIR